MYSPFEELEQLADLLPDEGEAVVLTRMGGELVCRPHVTENGSDGVSDPEFYGRLVQANERLNALSVGPIWLAVLGLFWTCVALHLGTGLGWEGWFLDAGLAIFVMLGCARWIAGRQVHLYVSEIRPMLRRHLQRRCIDRFVLLGAVRMRPELRALMESMARDGNR